MQDHSWLKIFTGQAWLTLRLHQIELYHNPLFLISNHSCYLIYSISIFDKMRYDTKQEKQKLLTHSTINLQRIYNTVYWAQPVPSPNHFFCFWTLGGCLLASGHASVPVNASTDWWEAFCGNKISFGIGAVPANTW